MTDIEYSKEVHEEQLRLALTYLNMALQTLSFLGYEIPEKIEFNKIEPE